MPRANKIITIISCLALCLSTCGALVGHCHADMGVPYTFEQGSGSEYFTKEDAAKERDAHQKGSSGYYFTVNDYQVLGDSAYLYKGPDESYGKLDDEYLLPVGTRFSSEFHDDLWVYVENDGHTGWARYNNRQSPDMNIFRVAEMGDNIIYSTGHIDLVDNLKDKNIIYSFDTEDLEPIIYSYYAHLTPFDETFYIERDGHAGWIKDVNQYATKSIYDYDTRFMNVMDIKLKSSFNGEADIDLPMYSEFQLLYEVGQRPLVAVYIKSGNIKGWYAPDGYINYLSYADSGLLSRQNGRLYSITLDEETNTFDHFSSDTPSGTIAPGEYSYYYAYSFCEQLENYKCKIHRWYYISTGEYYYDSPHVWVEVVDSDEKEMSEVEKSRTEELLEIMKSYDYSQDGELDRFYRRESKEEENRAINSAVYNDLLWLSLASVIFSTILIVILIRAKRKQNDQGNPPVIVEPKPEEPQPEESKPEESAAKPKTKEKKEKNE